MIEPPATMPREGGPDTMRWFCLVMAHLRPDDPWWLPPPLLVAPNGNIAGPEWQYRVAPKPSNTQQGGERRLWGSVRSASGTLKACQTYRVSKLTTDQF